MDRRQFLKSTAAVVSAVPVSGLLGTGTSAADPVPTLPGKQAIIDVVRRVNDHWIGANPDPPTNQWDPATYFNGNMAAHRLTGEQRYLDYTVAWAQSHQYGLNEGAQTRVADNQCAGQAYLDLFEVLGGDEKIAAIEDSLHRMITEDPDRDDDWWWVDALHMAMPSFARLGTLRKDPAYYTKLFALYDHTKRTEGGGLYDTEAALWYRDANFAPSSGNKQSPNGKPILWSRGNGWALAAHSKVLAALPSDDEHAQEYRDTVTAMSKSLLPIQRTDGFWNPNLADPDHVPCTETSGTALFAYGMASGVRAGILDQATYLPAIARAWNGMVATAVHSDGVLGWVQGVGSEPDSSQPITADSTTDFGVGAFLLAGSEIAQLAA